MSKAEKTRQFIIEKTAELFNRKGYAATSLSDITEVTGLSKGSIYGNFTDKDEVAIAVYQYNARNVRVQLDAFVEGKTGAVEKLLAFTKFYRDNWKGTLKLGGCPLMNAAVEAAGTFPGLQKEAAASFESWIKKVAVIIEQGKKSGELKSTADSKKYPGLFIALVEGGVVLARATGKQAYLYDALDRINHMIAEELKQ